MTGEGKGEVASVAPIIIIEGSIPDDDDDDIMIKWWRWEGDAEGTPIQVDLATSYIERSIPGGGGFVIGFTAHSTMLYKRKPKHLASYI